MISIALHFGVFGENNGISQVLGYTETTLGIGRENLAKRAFGARTLDTF